MAMQADTLLSTAPPPILNYSGTFLSCYADDGEQCFHKMRDHSLVYVYAGEMVLEEPGKKTLVHKGECVFIRRDHRILMTKKSFGKEPYRGIAIDVQASFPAGVLQ